MRHVQFLIKNIIINYLHVLSGTKRVAQGEATGPKPTALAVETRRV